MQAYIRDKLIESKQYIADNGQDLPEIWNGRWEPPSAAGLHTPLNRAILGRKLIHE